MSLVRFYSKSQWVPFGVWQKTICADRNGIFVKCEFHSKRQEWDGISGRCWCGMDRRFFFKFFSFFWCSFEYSSILSFVSSCKKQTEQKHILILNNYLPNTLPWVVNLKMAISFHHVILICKTKNDYARSVLYSSIHLAVNGLSLQ